MKVGNYVRTKEGIIFKVIGGDLDHYNIDIPFSILEDSMGFCIGFLENNDNGWYFNDERNFKAIKEKIIELIQVGDYVNGYLVTMVGKDVYEKPMVFVGQRLIEESGFYKTYYDNEIKSIVTKEQFKSKEYHVG